MAPPNFSRSAALAGLVCLGIALGAAGQSSAPAKKSALAKPAPGMAEEDREFANKAAAGGIAEVELGRAAQHKTKSIEVRKYADRMVADHGTANDELKALAAQKKIPLPTAPSRVTQIEIEKLQKNTGAKFDLEYLEHMVKDHKKDIALFEKQAKSGKDAELKKWAGDKLPILQEHLRLAEAALAAAKGEKKKK